MLVAKGDCCALWVNKELLLENGLLALYSDLENPTPAQFLGDHGYERRARETFAWEEGNKQGRKFMGIMKR